MNSPIPSGDSAVPANAPFPGSVSAGMARFFSKKRGNGLSLAAAAEIVARVPAAPNVALEWANPLADTEFVRFRKLAAAETLGSAFSATEGRLARAAGTLCARHWSEKWQADAEAAAKSLIDAGEKLDDALAQWVMVSGLLPLAGTLSALKELLALVGALLAVRGENATLVFGDFAGKNLERLSAATTLAENCVRHKTLLSLPYPDSASRDSRLEEWLRLWNESEFSAAFSRWRTRRKIVRNLCALAGSDKKLPLDPRVDLGNLIAIRNSRAQFAEEFSELPSAHPSFFGTEEDFSKNAQRLRALEKAQNCIAGTLAKLDSVPEKRAAWQAVIARWVGGNAREFAAGGSIETAFSALKTAYENFRESVKAFTEITEAELPESAADSSGETARFAAEMLNDSAFWRSVCAWNALAYSAERRGMAAFAASVRAGVVPAETAGAIFEVNYCRRWAEAVFAGNARMAERLAGKNTDEILAGIAQLSTQTVPADANGDASPAERGEFCLADSNEMRETPAV